MSRAREFADLAGSVDAGGLTGRNLIINGAMQVAQRGTSETGLTNVTYNTVDRFFCNTSVGSGSLVRTEEQSTDAPDGFSNSLKLSVTTASTNTNYGIFEQRIEGQNLQHLNWSSSSGKSLTASFYIKSSETGTMVFGAYTSAGGARGFAKTFTYNTANTWQRVVINIPNDTGGSALANDNTVQFRTWIVFDAGGVWATGTQQDGWASYNQANMGVDVDTDILSTLNATVQVTGVQLEVGEQATPFEHRSYGDELLRCQRYFFKQESVSGSYLPFGFGTWFSASRFISNVQFPVPMRANPSVTITGDVEAWDGTSPKGAIASVGIESSGGGGSPTIIKMDATNLSGATSGNHGFLMADNDSDASLEYSAEL